MNRSEIWLGDLLRVFEELQPRSQDEAAAIARMLKLERVSAAPEILQLHGAWSPGASPRHAHAPSPKVHVSQEEGNNAPVFIEEPASSVDDEPGTKLTLISTGSLEISTPAWVSSTTPLPRVKTPLAAPSPRPLIKKRLRRAILSAALATRVPDGPPDLNQIFHELTNCRPLAELPMLPRTTLRQGAQVLVDGWLGMAPFLADEQSMVEAIRRMIPPDRFELLHFAGCPARGVGTDSRKDWHRWEAPPRHTRVLVLSDLGIGGPLLDNERANASEWLNFAKRVREAGCPLAALVPYEPARWPRELANSITIIHWSERLTAGAIRRTIRRGWLGRE